MLALASDEPAGQQVSLTCFVLRDYDVCRQSLCGPAVGVLIAFCETQ